MPFIVLLGRILFSAIFILSAPDHFTQEKIAYGANYGVPLASLLVPLSGILSLFGGLSILLGYYARYGAWLIVIFLIPVTLMMHKFWSMDPVAASLQKMFFTHNLALLGGALIIAYFGSGPWSLNNKNKPIYFFKD